MARPKKPRTLALPARPVVYIPAGWTGNRTQSAEVAIEDYEVMRLVDGHALSLEEAAIRIGLSRSTAGRMLERARRVIAIAIERQAPLYIDASEDLLVEAPVRPVDFNAMEHAVPRAPGLKAIAVTSAETGSEVERIFGRARYFQLVDDSGDASRFLENPGHRAGRSSALLAVALLKANGVRTVVAGRYGPDALEALREAGIATRIAAGMCAPQAIALLFQPHATDLPAHH